MHAEACRIETAVDHRRTRLLLHSIGGRLSAVWLPNAEFPLTLPVKVRCGVEDSSHPQRGNLPNMLDRL